MLRNEFKIAVRFTLITAVVLGILYPLAVTGIGHVAFSPPGRRKLDCCEWPGDRLAADRAKLYRDQYFHGRPSAAGNGFDATASSPSNYAASNQKLISRIDGDVAHYAAENKGQPVPIDLVTASGSGLDPDISPAAAMFRRPGWRAPGMCRWRPCALW